MHGTILKTTEQKEAELRSALLYIERRDGKVTAAALTDYAMNEDSPLHEGHGYIWNVNEAARVQWDDHSRTIIKRVRYKVSETPYSLCVPFYVRDPREAPKPGFVSVTKAKLDKELAKQVIANEMSRIRGCVERAQKLAHIVKPTLDRDFDNLISAVESIEKKVL